MYKKPDYAADYTKLPGFILLQQLLPVLSQYRFGVGGSLLLTELGLLNQARDLDLVCAAADFAAISRALTELPHPWLRRLTVSAHPLYQSEYFERFVAADGTELDLMANIRVQQDGSMVRWQFDETQLQLRHAIPWMSAQQWLELYQLFQRPQRVDLLRQFLLGHDSVD